MLSIDQVADFLVFRTFFKNQEEMTDFRKCKSIHALSLNKDVIAKFVQSPFTNLNKFRMKYSLIELIKEDVISDPIPKSQLNLDLIERPKLIANTKNEASLASVRTDKINENESHKNSLKNAPTLQEESENNQDELSNEQNLCLEEFQQREKTKEEMNEELKLQKQKMIEKVVFIAQRSEFYSNIETKNSFLRIWKEKTIRENRYLFEKIKEFSKKKRQIILATTFRVLWINKNERKRVFESAVNQNFMRLESVTTQKMGDTILAKLEDFNVKTTSENQFFQEYSFLKVLHDFIICLNHRNWLFYSIFDEKNTFLSEYAINILVDSIEESQANLAIENFLTYLLKTEIKLTSIKKKILFKVGLLSVSVHIQKLNTIYESSATMIPSIDLVLFLTSNYDSSSKQIDFVKQKIKNEKKLQVGKEIEFLRLTEFARCGMSEMLVLEVNPEAVKVLDILRESKSEFLLNRENLTAQILESILKNTLYQKFANKIDQIRVSSDKLIEILKVDSFQRAILIRSNLLHDMIKEELDLKTKNIFKHFKHSEVYEFVNIIDADSFHLFLSIFQLEYFKTIEQFLVESSQQFHRILIQNGMFSIELERIINIESYEKCSERLDSYFYKEMTALFLIKNLFKGLPVEKDDYFTNFLAKIEKKTFKTKLFECRTTSIGSEGFIPVSDFDEIKKKIDIVSVFEKTKLKVDQIIADYKNNEKNMSFQIEKSTKFQTKIKKNPLVDLNEELSDVDSIDLEKLQILQYKRKKLERIC